MANSPTKKFSFGNCTLSMFENKGNKDGQSYVTKSYTPQKVYRKDNEFKFSNSFKPAELFYLIQACQAALIDHYKKDYEQKPSQSNESPI